MTFEQFLSTKRRSNDVTKELDYSYYEEGQTGFIYCDNLVIEDVMLHWPLETQQKGRYHLCIGNTQRISNDLRQLEHTLYRYALSEGFTHNS